MHGIYRSRLCLLWSKCKTCGEDLAEADRFGRHDIHGSDNAGQRDLSDPDISERCARLAQARHAASKKKANVVGKVRIQAMQTSVQRRTLHRASTRELQAVQGIKQLLAQDLVGIKPQRAMQRKDGDAAPALGPSKFPHQCS